MMETMNDEQAVENLEVNPPEKYQAPRDNSSDDIDHILNRNFSDDQRSSSLKPSPSMYSNESPYDSIPLGMRSPNYEPNMYYLSNLNAAAQPLESQRSRKSQSGSDDHLMIPTVFLEPKVISEPIFYSLANRKQPTMIEVAPPVTRKPRVPFTYTINTGQDRRQTIDIPKNQEFENGDEDEYENKIPTIYSLRPPPSSVRNEDLEPAQQLPIPKPSMYSLTNSPARTSRGIQVDMTPIHPAPILYTVVGDTPASTNRPKDDYLSPTTIRKPPPNNTTTFSPQPETEKSPRQAVFYTLVDDPQIPAQLQSLKPAKPPIQKKTPPAITINDRDNRQVERQSQIVDSNNSSLSTNKNKYESTPPQPKAPKADAMFIPSDDEDYHSRPEISRQLPPFETTPNRLQRKPFTATPYRSIRYSDYRSPYAYGAQKTNYEREPANEKFPVISNNRPNTKLVPSNREPRYRNGQQNQSNISKSPSMRYKSNSKERSTFSNNDYLTQTDDDEEYDQKLNKKKQNNRQAQPRAPWIPVW